MLYFFVFLVLISSALRPRRYYRRFRRCMRRGFWFSPFMDAWGWQRRPPMVRGFHGMHHGPMGPRGPMMHNFWDF